MDNSIQTPFNQVDDHVRQLSSIIQNCHKEALCFFNHLKDSERFISTEITPIECISPLNKPQEESADGLTREFMYSKAYEIIDEMRSENEKKLFNELNKHVELSRKNSGDEFESILSKDDCTSSLSQSEVSVEIEHKVVDHNDENSNNFDFDTEDKEVDNGYNSELDKSLTSLLSMRKREDSLM